MEKYYLENLTTTQVDELTKRPAIDFKSVFATVRKVLEDVKENGDKAVKAYTKRFDGVEVENIEVSKEEIAAACSKIEPKTKEAFAIAASNIEKFHETQLTDTQPIETSKGVKCFRQSRPIEKVGLYIPGGTAPLPSTVLMLAIPAKLAGCKEITMCTPPDKNGKVPDIILYAAKLAGIDKIYKIGGAQAIAAMGYGTESVPKSYKIFGPGNQYVTAAKMLLSIEPGGAAMD
ncbi:histidinol dehydrogenase, partial [Candidatus Peregrinibacteria bacterium]|nr:histidinol dehydrogenase [Candidatus Peregrinibacteria bacterium]